MLEVRSAYGYYGELGGMTGENDPSFLGSVERRMPYYKFKKEYSNCKHYDYDPKDKTIVVLIPEERQQGSNFGNKYSISRFSFWVYDEYKDMCYVVTQDAKNIDNATKHIKKWCRDTQKGLCGAVRIKFLRVAKHGEHVDGYITTKEYEMI